MIAVMTNKIFTAFGEKKCKMKPYRGLRAVIQIWNCEKKKENGFDPLGNLFSLRQPCKK